MWLYDFADKLCIGGLWDIQLLQSFSDLILRSLELLSLLRGQFLQLERLLLRQLLHLLLAIRQCHIRGSLLLL